MRIGGISVKIKSEIKDYQRRVKVKLSYREKMNEKELEKFSHISTRVFLKPQLVKGSPLNI